MKIYQKSEESGDSPAWICGHWNGSPLAIGTGLRAEVGTSDIRHYHPYREYYVVLEGAAELEVEGVVVPMCPGMVILVEPGERHMVVSVDKAGARWVVIQERSEPNTKYIA